MKEHREIFNRAFMMKHVPWDQLIELIGRFPDGASLEEIMLGLGSKVPRRTLQRWLASLVKNKELIAVGRTRGRRYKLFHIEEKQLVPITKGIIPLTEFALSIEKQIVQPLQSRHPVTYNREFLESYKPNATFYIPENSRKKLFALGGTQDGKYPAGTYARQIFHRLLIDLSWNSSRLEGNTYSILETERLIDAGTAAVGKDIKETQMILNHKAAIEFLVNTAEEIGINRFAILNLHTLLSDNLLGDPAAGGRLRTIAVGIYRSTYLPIAIPQVINECFDLLVSKAQMIQDPFEQAFFLMVHLPYLQPFDDVNKRTSRLAANIPLIRQNLCPLSFVDVPEETYIDGLLGVYELNRVELLRDVFMWAYERSCIRYSTVKKAIGEPDPFRMQYRNEIKKTVEAIVCGGKDKHHAISLIRKKALESIPSKDQIRFIETVEKELQGLHEGNIARYQIRLLEFENWKKSWK